MVYKFFNEKSCSANTYHVVVLKMKNYTNKLLENLKNEKHTPLL